MATFWTHRAGVTVAVAVGIFGFSAVAADGAVLPDHRAYEAVSLGQKSGADVLIDTSRVRAAIVTHFLR